MRVRQGRATLVGLFLILVCAPARPSGNASGICEPRMVLMGGSLSVMILPWVNPGGGKALSDIAARLASLAQLDLMSSLMRYADDVRVEVWNPEASCDSESGLAVLTGDQPDGDLAALPGRGGVVVWAQVYEEGEHLYVQSYIRFWDKEVGSRGIEMEGELFTARLPARTVVFPVRHLTSGQVVHIADALCESLVVRGDPGANAGFPEQGASGCSEEEFLTGGGVNPIHGGIGHTGVMVMGSEIQSGGSERLRMELRELSFADGLLGYLRSWVLKAEDRGAEGVEAMADGVLTRYLDRGEPAGGGCQ